MTRFGHLDFLALSAASGLTVTAIPPTRRRVASPHGRLRLGKLGTVSPSPLLVIMCPVIYCIDVSSLTSC